MTTRVALRRDAGRIGPESGPWIRQRQVRQDLGTPGPREPRAARRPPRRRPRLGPAPRPTPTSRCASSTWATSSARRPAGSSAGSPSALAARAGLGLGESPDTTAYREVNSEGDGLPGLVVDRYGDDRVIRSAPPRWPPAARRSWSSCPFAHPGPDVRDRRRGRARRSRGGPRVPGTWPLVPAARPRPRRRPAPTSISVTTAGSPPLAVRNTGGPLLDLGCRRRRLRRPRRGRRRLPSASTRARAPSSSPAATRPATT